MLCRYLIVILLLNSSMVFSWELGDSLTPDLTINDLIAAGVTIEQVEQSESNKKLNKAERAILKRLKKEAKKLKRQTKRSKDENHPVNNHFFGQEANAENAADDQIKIYKEIFNELELLFANKSINQSTYTEAKRVIDDLMFAHVNNRQICSELAKATKSETYGNRLSIHAEGKEISFERRAEVMFNLLYLSFTYSKDNGLLVYFFEDGLGKGSGCLEARMRKLDKWRRQMVSYQNLDNLKLDRNSKFKILPLPAEKAAWKILENAFDQLDAMLDLDNWQTIEETAQFFYEQNINSLGVDQKPLSFLIFREHLKTLFQIRSPTLKNADKFDFDESLILKANHRSYEDIKQAQLSSGNVVKVRLKKTVNDGNCGFHALNSDRNHFIKLLVNSFYSKTASKELKILIQRAILEAGFNNLEDWIEAFSSPGFWMNDTHLAIFALLHNMTINVYMLDHERNMFVLVQTFNPGQQQTAHIVNINLNPVILGEAGHNLGQNHFDALELVDEVMNQTATIIEDYDFMQGFDFELFPDVAQSNFMWQY